MTSAVSQQGYGPDHDSRLGYSLHHVQLAMPPGAESSCRTFYIELLGMTEIAKPPGIRVSDLDEVARRLQGHGELTWDENFPGHRRFYADDPVGNRLEFLQRDGSPAIW